MKNNLQILKDFSLLSQSFTNKKGIALRKKKIIAVYLLASKDL